MSPVAQAVLDQLDDTRQRWWLFSLLCNILLAGCSSLAMIVAFIMADVLLLLPQKILGALLVVWLAATVSLLLVTVLRILRYQRGLEAAARRVELSFPEVGSDLINLIQLVHSAEPDTSGFHEAAITDAAHRMEGVRFSAAAGRHTAWQRWRLGLQTPHDLAIFTALAAVVVGLSVSLGMAFPTWASSMDRLFKPWTFVPQVGAVKIVEVAPGNAELLVGSRLEVTARVDVPEEMRAPRGKFYFQVDGENAENERELAIGNDPRLFRYTIPTVTRSLRYRLQIGDSQSDIYRVTASELPTITSVRVTYEYPSYLGMPERQVQQQQADLEGPQYAIAHLQVASAAALSRGHAQIKDRQIPGEVGRDGKTLTLSIPLVETTNYTLHLYNTSRQTDSAPRVNCIRVAVDAPPTVQLLKPLRESSCPPGEEVSLAMRAADDHGLGAARFEWKPSAPEAADAKNGSGDIAAVRKWDSLQNAAAMTLAHSWKLEGSQFTPGKELMVRAVVSDARQLSRTGLELKPQEAVSEWHRIRIADPQQIAAQSLEQIDGINAKLREILKLQVLARVSAAEAARQEDSTAVAKSGQDIRQRQVQIQTRTAEISRAGKAAKEIDRADLRQSLAKLANGEMLKAVQQADALARLKHTGELPQTAPPLMETQDAIIEALRALLDEARQAANEALAEMKDRPGGDLPKDVQEKLMKLSEKLQEFLHQQKKVVEASENLAKKPVDDFTDEDEKQLADLAAIEDSWSQFMGETHSDFSKLPEQDFANASIAKELVEVQTELKMAEGALTKKTADIAVPLEQLGVEMAEEMLTNIEKWLPDTPDRERWSQEESLADDMKEAPMAELPGELEDIVGELMEEEEDLFDEMEDVSSSMADSIDKGAGWDAMDGPISNMSARGVTGNRLPNSSEIGGRSGEGRQGKSSGEFVSDTAVGKGGRKTPTRLSSDAYQKGQVKDVSKDPTGGATGGGKESGAGGEGLEGPVPPQKQRELDRMAQRQADLRNRAEAVDVKFQVMNYHHTDLQKMIEMMAAVEQDLKSGRYQSAMRRRQVLLDGLGNVKTYAEGEFEVRKDETSNLPGDIQKELLGSMSEASPAGWEELNRKYFQRLSASDAASAPSTTPSAERPPAEGNAAEKPTSDKPAAEMPAAEKQPGGGVKP